MRNLSIRHIRISRESMSLLLNTPGKRIERLRKDREWTQADLAAAAHVRQNYISGIENGSAKPSAAIMARIAKALGVSLDFIMVLSDNPTVNGDEKPTYYSVEAEEAAHIIDGLPASWRGVVLDLVKDYDVAYKDVLRRAKEFDKLLREIEAAGGPMAREVLEKFIRANGGISIDPNATPK